MPKNFALVRDGCVENVFRNLSDDATPTTFSPVNAALLFECPNECQPGWSYNNATWTAPAPQIHSARQLRRLNYFVTLRKEVGDDEITVLGDTLDVLLAQVEAIRAKTNTAMTADYADLLGKVAAVKAKLPK